MRSCGPDCETHTRPHGARRGAIAGLARCGSDDLGSDFRAHVGTQHLRVCDPKKGGTMLFCATWEFTDLSEAGTARSLQVFAQWKPPDEAEFKGFFGFADGTGGVALIEVDSAETLQRVIAPWTPWLRFNTRAIIPIETAAAIAGEGLAFRASVS